jgi:surface carbohydrate biosynthesis protein
MKIAVYIENKVRDLRGMVWLGLHLTNYGHEVILGETASIRNGIDLIEPDVWVRGGLTRSKRKIGIAKSIKESGGSLVVVESEGGLTGNSKYKKEEINHEMAEYVDLHFTWGERQTNFINEELQNYEAVQTTGNPRFDLLTKSLRRVYKKESELYKKNYGNYILVALNFAIGNRDSSTDNFDKEQVKYQKRLLSEYIKTIQQLSSEVDYNIILRPHPREDIATYKKQFNDTDGVYTIRKGSVRPWILSAKAVIHKSSTTGIESVLLDTPAFSYRPIRNKTYDAELPILVSEEIISYEELSQALSSNLDDDSVLLPPDVKERVHREFHNFEEPVAGPLIADAIDSLDIDNETVDITGVDPSLKTRLKRFGVRVFSDEFVESIGEVVLGTDRSGVRNKFPGLSTQELISEIKLIDGASEGSFPDVTVKKVPSLVNTFSIQPND